MRLLAPVLPRSKVVGIGRNYAAHAAELGNEVPAEPLMFLKPNTSVDRPGRSDVLPAVSRRSVHYEGELAVVIGRICRDVPRERVRDVVFGYTVGNDVTARDLQRSDVQWTRAKGFDSFCPLGPWIETELDAERPRVQTFLNGDVQQDGSTNDMIFDVADAGGARLQRDDAAARRRHPHRDARGRRPDAGRRRGGRGHRGHRHADEQDRRP